MLTNRYIEKNFHITKLKLLEICPLVPFLMSEEKINCLEVGGNIGLWCEGFMELFAPQVSSYVAYEPMPKNIERFALRLQEWDSNWPSVDIINTCVGSFDGNVCINFDSELTTLASVVIKETIIAGKKVINSKSRDVRQVTLDGEIERLALDTVTFVKVDVEGYEWDVIQGGLKSLSSGAIRNMYFEFGQHQAEIGQNFKQFFELLKDLGYDVYIQQVGRNYFGLNELRQYKGELGVSQSMLMVLASLSKPSIAYKGPRVIGLM